MGGGFIVSLRKAKEELRGETEYITNLKGEISRKEIETK